MHQRLLAVFGNLYIYIFSCLKIKRQSNYIKQELPLLYELDPHLNGPRHLKLKKNLTCTAPPWFRIIKLFYRCCWYIGMFVFESFCPKRLCVIGWLIADIWCAICNCGLWLIDGIDCGGCCCGGSIMPPPIIELLGSIDGCGNAKLPVLGIGTKLFCCDE